MNKVLIVDDDITVLNFLTTLMTKLEFRCDKANSRQETERYLKNPDEYMIALVDVILPDAKEGECIDMVLSKDIPVIAMTGSSNQELQSLIRSKDIIDYVSKENQRSFDYAMRIVRFVSIFKNTQILIVDDSKTSRQHLRFMLDTLPLKLHEACDGAEALTVLKQNPEIKLVITDKNMPNMDGVEFIRQIRQEHSIYSLVVIGISAGGEQSVCAEFLKNGANDFVTKPFFKEEILSKIVSNLEMIHYIKAVKDLAVIDYLTKLHNRKYLYEVGEKLYKNAKRERFAIVIAMIDIDFFKKINDRYGHEAGDYALKTLGELLSKSFRDSDVVARYGGEEFCVILTNTEIEKAKKLMDNLRIKVEKRVMEIKNISFRLTISVGLNDNTANSFDQMISLADKNLYKAKKEGRNRIVS